MTNVLGGFTNRYLNQTFMVTIINYPNGQNSQFTYEDTDGDFAFPNTPGFGE